MVRVLAFLVAAVVLAACGGQATLVDTDATPTAEASADGGQQQEGAASVGDKIKLGDEQYFTVTKVANWPGSDFIKPDSGNKFLSVLVKIEGLNPDGSSYNPFFFKLKDADGFEYNYSGFGKEPQLQSSNQLRPGEKVLGWMTFEVPKSAGKLTLIYSPDFFGVDEPARVKLQAP